MGMIWEGRALTGAEVEALRADPESLWELVEEEGGEPPAVVDLDKAWHGIHWLLTGVAGQGDGPLADAIMGGEEFGEDNGYGAPRLLDPTAVAAVAAALDATSTDDLRSRFDPQALQVADVYPAIWTDADVFDTYLAPNFEDLQALYAYAAADGRWVLQSIV